MKSAPIGLDENERQKTLDKYFVLDTEIEQIFDDVTQLASAICQTPIALISLVDQNRQWFKSRYGLDAEQTPRDISFCGHAIHQTSIFEVPDALLDPRFFDNPLVTGDPVVRFYAGAPLISPNGHAIGTLCVIDHSPKLLTEDQKNALEKLASHVINLLELTHSNGRLYKTNVHLNTILQNMHDGIVLQNSLGDIIEHNESALKILGLTADQINGKNSKDPGWRAIHENGEPFPGEEHPAMISLRTGKLVKDVLMGLKKDEDDIRWIKINSAPIFDIKSKKPIFVISTFSDITEQKIMQDEIQFINKKIYEKQILLDSVIENIPSGIILKDVKNDYKITLWNKSAEKILMRKSETVIGKNVFDIYTQELAAQYDEWDRNAFDSGKLIEIQNAVSNIPEKGEISLHTRKLPISINSDEGFKYLLTVVDDVTEQKNLQDEILKAKDVALAAAKSKSEFLSNMSHEIRTPMNGIVGMCNLILENSSLPQQDEERIKIIQNCSNTLLELINDLLDFSKLEAGKMQIENISFDLNNKVNDLITLFNGKASEKGIELTYSPNSNVPDWILGDPTRFQQILMNLISNALKFTEKGSIKIFSSATIYNDKELKIEFSIEDTGCGISEEGQKKLFKDFSQVDASTTRKYGGTGLGLAICKGLCEQMGGVIFVKSKPGLGSTFIFNFIARKANKINTKISTKKSSHFDSMLANKYPMKILVAEDNKVNQQVILGYLEKLGYKPDLAVNGIKVLEYLEQKKYDLILMDCHMPEMDGFLAAKEICKKYEKTNRPRIIALTASNMKEDIELCFASGMNGYIGKPIVLDSLVKTLMESVSFSNNREESKTPSSITFDHRVFMLNFKGIEELAYETIEIFLSTLPNLIAPIKDSINHQDFLALEHSAHALKGAISNFYAEPSKKLAFKLEQLGHNKTTDGAQKIFDELILEINHFSKELQNFIKEKKLHEK